MQEKFKEQMRELLSAEFTAFEAAYESKPRHKALRVNTLKISVDDFVALVNSREQDGVKKYNLRINPLCKESCVSYTHIRAHETDS